MSGLQLLWFGIICLLFIVFMCLEGADFGVGMSYLFITKEKKEQDALVSTIEATWDGSEVWLVAAIGGMFASFPRWYASLLSGYYLLFLLLIIGLIFRGVAIHFRLEMGEKGNRFFDKAMVIGSLIPPLMLGIIFASMSSGITVDSLGNIKQNFSDYFSLYTISAGLLVLATSFYQGLNYLGLKTAGSLREKVLTMRKKYLIVVGTVTVIFLVLLPIYTPYLKENLIYSLLLILLLVLGVGIQFKKEPISDWIPYLGTSLMFVSELLLLISGAFPNVIVSSNNPAYSISVGEASSSPQTLKLMTLIALILVPIIIIYQIYMFYLFRKRVSVDS